MTAQIPDTRTDTLTDTRDAYPDGDLRAAAVRSLKAKRDFGGHLVVYVAVGLLLTIIWLMTFQVSESLFFWPAIPMAGWGIGVAAHAWSAYGRPAQPFSEQAIRREEQRLLRR